MAEMKQTIVVGALVTAPDGDILLVRHHRRGWELPQGRLEEGEGLTDALRREIEEESGIIAGIGPLAAVYSKLTPPGALILNFLAEWIKGTPAGSDETLDAGWFPADQARSMIEHPVNLLRLDDLLDWSGRVVYRTYSTGPFTLHAESYFTGIQDGAGS